ncbi:glycoside hydrolase/phage tail family protein [Ciceribacter sp. L1K23]|nr:glycoside hydrolase/phage tail family protein [Ciceribacter sp. L1K23]
MFGPLGAIVGRAAGALAGNVLDRALLGGGNTVTGARLAVARVPGASEGTAINRVYGTARIGGTLIWATRFEEEVTVERVGGKAGGTKVENFRYFANLALGLCEGPIAGVRRVWADGREIDLTEIEMRVYRGTESQEPDPLIEAKQGSGAGGTGGAPAYRGLAYVVFERLPLDGFGNRIPVLQFEVMRPVGTLEGQIRAITIIPGATEHGYATVPVKEKTGAGAARIMNRNGLTAATDWAAAIDELQTLCPNLERVGLVVTWFGTDLRAGECRVVPGVEVPARRDESRPWCVSGISRGEAHVVSLHDGSPAYGGTPDDASVVDAIRDLKARGLEVYLYPFVMMDVPDGNDLPDPYGGGEQASYPWRGRITCHPAPGRPGSPDRTAAIRDAVEAFCGEAEVSGFGVGGTSVAYAGSDEGYRRMVLHYALLAEAAGGVDGFLIGSELRGLTTLRDEDDDFPFVAALVDLAADVRSVLGAGTKITYGADWSEYFGHQPPDGSGDVFFHLDPLWASPAIDAVGIDNYMPLGDWRDDDLGAENPDGFRTADDPDGLEGQVAAGEGFDWYYASEADRRARERSPITDGGAGKPWVYRYKDIENWWGNRHYERTGGVERPTPTAWQPGMKPIWFTELGCPAVDKGANQPNVFPDPKSAEGARPYFSSGARSDSAQRRFLEAHHRYWRRSARPAGMVDADHMFVWAWDARPYPAFPFDRDLWADGDNWRTGHWLNARLGAGTLADTIAAILEDHGIDDVDVSQVSGDLTGYVQGTVASARTLIEPLAEAFSLDFFERGSGLVVRSRNAASLPPRAVTVLADLEGEALWRETRGHDGDHAGEAILTFFDEAGGYVEASVRSRRVDAGTDRVLGRDLAAVLPEETAALSVEAMLRDHRLSRFRLELSLGPDRIDVEPGDVLTFPDGPVGRFLVTRIEDGAARRLTLTKVAPMAGRPVPAVTRPPKPGGGGSDGFAPEIVFMDLPPYETGDVTTFARVAALTRPWRRIALSSSVDGESYASRLLLERPATMGRLTAPLSAGLTTEFDRANAVELDLDFGELSSASELAVLNGANRMAVLAANGAWEVLGFVTATEMAQNRWRLTDLLRGLGGSEGAVAAGAAIGARVVLLDQAVRPLGLREDEIGLPLLWIAEAVGRTGTATAPVEFIGGMRAATPLAPVHLSGMRQPDGSARFEWVRRGRVDADGWQASEIPLDEPFERYRIEILDGGVVRRSQEVTQPAFDYPLASELADFGAVQPAIEIRVRQIGRRVADGLPAETIIVF